MKNFPAFQLAYQDSNLEWRYQKPLCCQLHHRPIITTVRGASENRCPLPCNGDYYRPAPLSGANPQVGSALSLLRYCSGATNGVTARAARSRASVDSRPSSSIDSNSGGETISPETATRSAP